MEIVHLILGKANPNRLNGVNKVVYQLASKQAQSGRNVSVWGIVESKDHNYGKRNFRTVLFKSQVNAFTIGADLKKAILNKKDETIFHLHGGWIPTYHGVSSFLHANGCKYVITAHGAYNTIAMKRSKWVKKIYFLLFEKTLLEHAEKIHLIGDSEIHGLEKIYPNTKSLLIPYGFNVSDFDVKNANINPLFVIGFVGRLDIYTKGLDLLVKAFSDFQHKEPNSELWIIGDSDQRPALESLAWAKNISDKVKFMGSRFGTEKDELIQKMDVFVHPSRNEGLPASVVEASNFGVPSVVTEATNIASYIRDYNAGIAVPNEDNKAITAAFHELYKMKKEGTLITLSRNAQTMVRTAFDWDRLVVDFDKLYE
jgi:glycosyltransferase involved in cell wall biosynthesis